MTVAELIAALRAMPQAAQVVRPDGEGDYVSVTRVGALKAAPAIHERDGDLVGLDFDPEDLA